MNPPFAALNDRILPAAQATVSIADRSFRYGDGLFETLRVARGRPFLWPNHCRRLWEGARFLRILPPLAEPALLEIALELIHRNQTPEGLLRLQLSRGVGGFGYSPQDAGPPLFVLTTAPAPEPPAGKLPGWRLVTASIRLPADNPLARFKTANRLASVLAKAEAQDCPDADDALLLNSHRHIAETSSANLFWIRHGTLHTPPLDAGVLPGITRAITLEIAAALAVPTAETLAPPTALLDAEGAFVSLSSLGLVEILALDRQPLARSPLFATLQKAYRSRLHTG